MSNIHFSDELLNKLNKGDVDENTAMLLKKFDPNRRQESKKTPKAMTTISPSSKKATQYRVRKNRFTKTKSKLDVPPVIPGIKINQKVRKKRQNRRRAKIQEIKKKKISEEKKLRRVREISASFTPSTPIMANALGFGANTNNAHSRKNNSNRKRIFAQDADQYDFAKQDIMRNIEYGHGRKRKSEWNDRTAVEFSKELDYLKRKRIEDPNDFDRQATK